MPNMNLIVGVDDDLEHVVIELLMDGVARGNILLNREQAEGHAKAVTKYAGLLKPKSKEKMQ